MTELLELDSGGVHHEVLADLADDAPMCVVEALAEREQQFLASLCVGHERGDGRNGVLFDFLGWADRPRRGGDLERVLAERGERLLG